MLFFSKDKVILLKIISMKRAISSEVTEGFNISAVTPSLIWERYPHFLSAYAGRLQRRWIDRMRIGVPFTMEELEGMRNDLMARLEDLNKEKPDAL